MSATWEDLVHEIEKLQIRMRRQGRIPWFRGHAKSSWEAKSSLHRFIEDATKTVEGERTEEEKRQGLLYIYKSLYRQFKAKAWSLLGARERSEWGIIFSMQHHGVPSRLLDWTESFACALYFAHCEWQPGDAAAIYVLDPEGLNLESVGQEGFIALDEESTVGQIDLRSYHPQYLAAITDHRPTIAVAPFLSNPRMLVQRAAFTITGDSFQPLEKQFGSPILTKILLPSETYETARQFLDLVGIGHFGYFPDFEGLTKEVKGSLNRQLRDAQSILNQKRK